MYPLACPMYPYACLGIPKSVVVLVVVVVHLYLSWTIVSSSLRSIPCTKTKDDTAPIDRCLTYLSCSLPMLIAILVSGISTDGLKLKLINGRRQSDPNRQKLEWLLKGILCKCPIRFELPLCWDEEANATFTIGTHGEAPFRLKVLDGMVMLDSWRAAFEVAPPHLAADIASIVDPNWAQVSLLDWVKLIQRECYRGNKFRFSLRHQVFTHLGKIIETSFIAGDTPTLGNEMKILDGDRRFVMSQMYRYYMALDSGVACVYVRANIFLCGLFVPNSSLV